MRGNGIVTDDTLMTLALMNIYGEVTRHLDAWDMAEGMVREIAWTPRWVPELQREAMLIERLFYPEKWIFQRHQLSRATRARAASATWSIAVRRCTSRRSAW